MRYGFKKSDLKARYDVETIHDDEWHSYSTLKTLEFLHQALPPKGARCICLNAGSGPGKLELKGWEEIPLDIFIPPIRGRNGAVCASVEALPFRLHTINAIICTGEVLAYCDPATAIFQFARALAPLGILICDFGSSRSFRYWFRSAYGRPADLVIDLYNGSAERIWIYDPRYIESLLTSAGLKVMMKWGTHTWSALARRVGLSMSTAVSMQRLMQRLQLPTAWADVVTIVAVRLAS
jgi:SAM-dependent methyltransferase